MSTAATTTKPPQPPPQRDMVEFVPFGAEDVIKLSAEIVMNYIAVKTKSGKTCTREDAIKFMMMCRSKRLDPFAGDAFLIGYDGRDGATFSLITAHQAFLKRAEVHPEYDGMESGVIYAPADTCSACDGKRLLMISHPTASGQIVARPERCPICLGSGKLDESIGDVVPEGKNLVGGWARISFKGRTKPMHKRVALKTFSKGYGRWNDDGAGMIVKCGEADALRSAFPTLLGGMMLREEVDKSELEQFTPTRPKLENSAMQLGALAGKAPAAAAPTPTPPAPATPEPATDSAPGEGNEPPPESAPEPEKPRGAAAAPANKPAPAKGASLTPEQAVPSLKEWSEANQIPEYALAGYLCKTFHISPCESLAEIADISPKRIVQAWEERDTHLAKLKPA